MNVSIVMAKGDGPSLLCRDHRLPEPLLDWAGAAVVHLRGAYSRDPQPLHRRGHRTRSGVATFCLLRTRMASETWRNAVTVHSFRLVLSLTIGLTLAPTAELDAKPPRRLGGGRGQPANRPRLAARAPRPQETPGVGGDPKYCVLSRDLHHKGGRGDSARDVSEDHHLPNAHVQPPCHVVTLHRSASCDPYHGNGDPIRATPAKKCHDKDLMPQSPNVKTFGPT
jgi:hypothetical protein